MTPQSKAMLWSEWDKCRLIYKAQGLNAKQIDDKRRNVIAAALGYPLSMKEWRRWKVAEVTEVKKRFLAISQPDGLNAQIAVIDGEETHRGKIYADCLNLCEVVIDGHSMTVADRNFRRERYLETMARNTHRKPFDKCTAEELAVIRGQLVKQIERQEAAAQKVKGDNPY